MKRSVIALLLRLYPKVWRLEYGAELEGVLARGSLGPAAVLDTVANAFGQQLRSGEPWLIVGAPLLALNLAMLAWDIFNPPSYADAQAGLQASVAQRVWFWLPAFCVGCWTVLRNPVRGHGGRAAVKSALLTSWPLCAVAILAGLGALRVVTIGPGDLPGTYSAHGLAITLYDRLGRATHLVPLFLLPFVNLPFAALGGWFGGLTARAWLRLEKI